MPVSYTHLDVYKRQIIACKRTEYKFFQQVHNLLCQVLTYKFIPYILNSEVYNLAVALASEKNCEIVNSIWDGQSLMDISLFGDYSDYGMILLRRCV